MLALFFKCHSLCPNAKNIYWEFYHGIVHIDNGGRHGRIDVKPVFKVELIDSIFVFGSLTFMFSAIVLSVHVYIVAHFVIALLMVELKKICAIFIIIICLYLYYRWYFKYIKKRDGWEPTNWSNPSFLSQARTWNSMQMTWSFSYTCTII